MRPLVLMTTSSQRKGNEFEDASVSLSNRYSQAVVAAGGLPVCVPCVTEELVVDEIVSRADGILLTGGEDVQPNLYRTSIPANVKKTLGLNEPARDLAELLVIKAAFRQQKPILAICRGQQMLNVALGGTLYSDIELEAPKPRRHNCMEFRDKPVHTVSLTKGSLLGRIMKTGELKVNSTHHQAVREVAEPLWITAKSDDGIIESLELKPELRGKMPFLLAIQFHPERLIHRHREFLLIFKAFVSSCGNGN